MELEDFKVRLSIKRESSHHEPVQKAHWFAGVGLMTGCVLIYSLVSLATKEAALASNLKPVEIYAASSVIQSVFSELLMRKIYKFGYSEMEPAQVSLVLRRLFATAPAVALLNYAIIELPIGLCQVIQSGIPFVVILLSHYLLAERTNRCEILNAVACSVIIATISSGKASSSDQTQFGLPMLANVGSVLLFSYEDVVLRQMKGLHFSVSNSFQTTALAIILGIASLGVRLQVADTAHISVRGFFVLQSIGALRFVANLMYVRAFQLDSAGRLASLEFISIISGYLLDVGWFGYEVSGLELAGSIAIAGCCCGVVLSAYLERA